MATNISRRNFVKIGCAGAATIALGGLAGCASGSQDANTANTVADTVVYGKIYTSNANRDYAGALAVKDGKYVYVGSEDGVKEFIKEGTTKIVDHRDKGLIMAGATEGHGHYTQDGMLRSTGLTLKGSTEDEIIANVKAYVEANPNKKVYYTFGWDNVVMQAISATIDMRSRLDEICSDKVMMIADDSGHNCFCNSKAFEVAGVTGQTEIAGGVFAKDESGNLLGLCSDMANNYMLKYAVSTQTLLSESDYEGVVKATEEKLHSYGYTYYQDGWLNYFSTELMDALKHQDNKDGLNIVVSGSYKIDSFDDWEKELEKAVECSKTYPTKHLMYNVIKLFSDGEAVESRSGWLINGYVDGSHGTQVWDTEIFNKIVKKANEEGLSCHVHAMGDGATKQTVEAFIASEATAASGVYNGVAHGRNYTDEIKKLMGEHNIYATQNINWRSFIKKENADLVAAALPLDTALAGYPIKSLVDQGINVSSSTDVPAAAGAPTDICGIMEVAVNDTRPDMEVYELNPEERVDIEQAMDIMTINGAKQLMIDAERGSIETGKYADFVLIDKDITTCEPNKIHEGVVSSVYFEGKEVYTK